MIKKTNQNICSDWWLDRWTLSHWRWSRTGWIFGSARRPRIPAASGRWRGYNLRDLNASKTSTSILEQGVRFRNSQFHHHTYNKCKDTQSRKRRKEQKKERARERFREVGFIEVEEVQNRTIVEWYSTIKTKDWYIKQIKRIGLLGFLLDANNHYKFYPTPVILLFKK